MHWLPRHPGTIRPNDIDFVAVLAEDHDFTLELLLDALHAGNRLLDSLTPCLSNAVGLACGVGHLLAGHGGLIAGVGDILHGVRDFLRSFSRLLGRGPVERLSPDAIFDAQLEER